MQLASVIVRKAKSGKYFLPILDLRVPRGLVFSNFIMSSDAATPPAVANAYRPEEAFAHELDAEDPLRHCRDLFLIPRQADGRPVVYLCGHSLGLQPKKVRAWWSRSWTIGPDWVSMPTFRGQPPGFLITRSCAMRPPAWSGACRTKSS